jgi:hypothetical protein
MVTLIFLCFAVIYREFISYGELEVLLLCVIRGGRKGHGPLIFKTFYRYD